MNITDEKDYGGKKVDNTEIAEKFQAILEADDDDVQEICTDFEVNFLTNLALNHEKTDCTFTSKEASIIEEIYEKLWHEGLI